MKGWPRFLVLLATAAFVLIGVAGCAGSPAGAHPRPAEPNGGGTTAETPRLLWPVARDAYVAVFFGPALDPFGAGTWYLHNGVDIVLSEGAAVLASADGVVELSGIDDSEEQYGVLVVVRHSESIQTLYAHLQEPPLVHVGDRVSAGQRVGAIGRTGRTPDAHLHFGVLHDGQPVDPMQYLREGDSR